MNDYPKWPHLENLDRVLRDIPDYLTREGHTYAVTEKVHGFNARFGKADDGTPWVGSRNQTVAEGDPATWDRNGLQGFVGFAADHMSGVAPGETLFGEWAGKGIQKGIDYGERGFYLFGQSLAGGVSLNPSDLELEAAVHDLRAVPVVAVRQVAGTLAVSHLDELRKSQSAISIHDREGIVISPWPPIIDQYGHVVIAKYKAPSFEERAHARREQAAPLVLENVQAFVDEYVTATRLEHVLDQVFEAINDPSSPGDDPRDVRHTGLVLKAMYEDIVREGRADFEALSETDQKAVGKYCARATKPLLDAARQQGMEEAA